MALLYLSPQAGEDTIARGSHLVAPGPLASCGGRLLPRVTIDPIRIRSVSPASAAGRGSWPHGPRYDALYVALAELHDLTLVTTDLKLARVPGVHCKIDVIPVE